MALSAILKKLREEKGIEQKELAAVLNFSVGTISNYENGVHCPNPTTLSALADYYEVSVDYLLGRTDCPYSVEKLEERISGRYTVKDLLRFLQLLPGPDRQALVTIFKSYERLLGAAGPQMQKGCASLRTEN